MPRWQSMMNMSGSALVGFVTLLALRLIHGPRQNSRMMSFEIVLLVALGVILGVVLVFKTPTLGEGVMALAVIALALQLNAQRPFSWPEAKTKNRPEPILLAHRRQCVTSGLSRTRTTEYAMLGLAEKFGYVSLEEVDTIVLEPDGSKSVNGSRGISILAPAWLAKLVQEKHSRGSE